MYKGVIDRYREYLPIAKKTPVISLNEGNTPLIYAGHLSSLLAKDMEVYLKYEGLNPTGSFKDRGMTVGVSEAKRPTTSEAAAGAAENERTEHQEKILIEITKNRSVKKKPR